MEDSDRQDTTGDRHRGSTDHAYTSHVSRRFDQHY
jgi:hypothetical protein